MTLDEMIQVLQDAKDGKDIEYAIIAYEGQWECCKNTLWNFADFKYRSVPEPIRLTVDSRGIASSVIRSYPGQTFFDKEYIELTDSVKQKLEIEE